MFKEVTRLSYLYSQHQIPCRQYFDPTWELVTGVSHIMFCFNVHCSAKYLPYVGIYSGTPNLTMFAS